MSWRQRLKSVPSIYRAAYGYRRRTQDRQIAREQREYESAAAERQLPLGEEPAEAVFERLRARLARRGIVWPPAPAGRRLHILYASVPGEWERHNIPPELSRVGEASLFFLDEQEIPLNRGWEEARRAVDEHLPRFVRDLHARRPIDLMLSYLSGSQISPSTIEAIGAWGIPTFAFHLDDRRSFRGVRIGGQWSGPAAVCRAYDLNLTNAVASLVKYRAEGANALFWPEAANPDFFRPLDVSERWDVTFCGQNYGQRPLLVEYLRSRGVQVACFGRGWEHGYQSAEDMVRIMNRTRVNLGFGFVNESSDQCLKGRDFEVPSCGRAYLTSHHEDLSRVYRVGVEIETYRDFEDCLDKIRRLLARPERRASLGAEGRRAVLERHTWARRVEQLLESRGLGQPPLRVLAGGAASP